MTAEPPLVVGLPTRLRLVEPLGAGVSASVWRARDTVAGTDVAVKLLPPPTTHGARQVHRERFEREGRALARLHGVEGIVALHELGVTPDGTAWLVMDLATGESLRERLARGEQLDAVALGAVLATALAEAHARGVVHGDLSPANVLFGDRGDPVLADFGMAALLGGGAGADGIAGFTPAYAAPERLRGAPPDPRSDVYALAATLWHVAHGAPPTGPGSGPRDGALSAQPADRPTAAELAAQLAVSSPGRTEVAMAPSIHLSPPSERARGRRPFWRRR